MICPPSPPHFNWHTILKDPAFRIACAHPSNTRMTGDLRRTTYLLALYPSLLITLTPGYFWYLSLHPKGVGSVDVTFGGGMSNDFLGDADVPELFATLKGLLDKVNVGQGVHGAGLPRSLLGHGGTGAPLTPRASQL